MALAKTNYLHLIIEYFSILYGYSSLLIYVSIFLFIQYFYEHSNHKNIPRSKNKQLHWIRVYDIFIFLYKIEIQMYP